MRFLFDQNLSHRLVALLAAEFPGSQHVRDVDMAADFGMSRLAPALRFPRWNRTLTRGG